MMPLSSICQMGCNASLGRGRHGGLCQGSDCAGGYWGRGCYRINISCSVFARLHAVGGGYNQVMGGYPLLGDFTKEGEELLFT